MSPASFRRRLKLHRIADDAAEGTIEDHVHHFGVRPTGDGTLVDATLQPD